MRTLKALAPLGLNVKRDVWHFIRYMFYYYDFRLSCFWAFNFRRDFGFYIYFCFWITQYLLHLEAVHSMSSANWLISLYEIDRLIDWTLIEVHSSCVIVSIYCIYIFICFMLSLLFSLYIIKSFCLFVCLFLVLVTHLFYLFHCSCCGYFICFTWWSVIFWFMSSVFISPL